MAAIISAIGGFLSGFRDNSEDRHFIRAQRWMMLHVGVLTIVTFFQAGYTFTYLNDKADIDMLAATAFNTSAAVWTPTGPKNVLKETFTKVSGDPVPATAVPELERYVLTTCVPFWDTIYTQQSTLRNFLWPFMIVYGIYAVFWWFMVLRKCFKPTVTKLERSEAKWYDFAYETFVWILTQVAEVVFISYAIIGLVNFYMNKQTPELFNTAREKFEPALTTNYDMTENCNAMDRVLGHDLWGKHTPWAADKIMMDIVLGVIIAFFTLIRYTLNAVLLYGKQDKPPDYGAGANIPGYATGYPPMYNIVTMR